MAMVGYDMSILGPLLSLPQFADKYQGNPGPLTVSRDLLLQSTLQRGWTSRVLHHMLTFL